MKTLKFQSKEEWLLARRGKITGTRLKDLYAKRATGYKIGFYKLVAERIGLAADDENPMDRGLRLESEAMERFVKETGKKVDTSLVMWVRDEDESIAISPDGFIGKTEAVEVKCLASANHIEAWHTQTIPDEYSMQAVQYFVVNDKLKKLHFCFYDPRIPSKDFFVIEVDREEVQPFVDEYLEFERKMLIEANKIINELTF